MRILYHHRTRGSGAAGNHIRQVVKALRALGHTVDVVSPPGVDLWKTSRRPSTANTERPGLAKLLRLRLGAAAFELMEMVYNGVTLWRLRGACRRGRYDFLYERYAIFGLAGLLSAQRRGMPLILEVNFTSRTPVYPPRTRVFQRLAERIDRRLFHDAHGIVAVSTRLKQHLVQDFGVREDKILVTPNAVDPAEFSGDVPARAARELLGMNGKLVVGFVGGFYPWHGLDLLLDAAQAIAAEQRDVRFLLIGDGAMRGALKRQVKRLGLEETVLFTGRVPHHELPGYLAGFDVGVMPDSNEYGSPMKILEYMGMGKPVVAPRLGPIEEIVDDRQEGILFERGDVRGLSRSIVTLLKDPELRRRLGSNGRRRVLARHTWEQNVRTLLAFYETTTKEGARQ